MPKPYDMPLYCPKCRREMSVKIQLPRVFQPGQPPSVKIIACPYKGCDGHIDPTMHGEIVGIWEGHGPAPFAANRAN